MVLANRLHLLYKSEEKRVIVMLTANFVMLTVTILGWSTPWSLVSFCTFVHRLAPQSQIFMSNTFSRYTYCASDVLCRSYLMCLYFPQVCMHLASYLWLLSSSSTTRSDKPESVEVTFSISLLA